MPLKRAALSCVDEVTPVAALVSAANTILLEPDGRRRATNTDVPGMVAALREAPGVGPGADRRTAAVLGGGATARSALAALASLVDHVDVYARSAARGAELLDLAQSVGLDGALRPWAARAQGLREPLVVVTTPAAAVDDLAGELPGTSGVLFDVGYDPWPTPLAAAWVRAGGRVVSGLDLLVHQAALQVELMTGRAVPLAVLRTAGLAALAGRGRGPA